jgi:NAD(P)-dependent dehydrogenase (short-subunit alcohol dehydrogenase family)
MAVASLFELKGRIAFVSGGRGHLGAAMVTALAEAGAHVIVNGRNAAALGDFVQSLQSRGLAAEAAAFDITDFGAVRRFFATRPRLDILVNNAVAMQVKAFAALEPADFAATYASQVTAGFEAVRAALPALENAVAASGEASVINIASMYGLVAPDGRIYADPDHQSPFHYGPAKAALLQLTRHLAAQLGPKRIRVNALVPGPFPAATDAEFTQRLGGRTMLRRAGRAEEIAGPLLFLASPAASFVTGSALTVDGGWTAW